MLADVVISKGKMKSTAAVKLLLKLIDRLVKLTPDIHQTSNTVSDSWLEDVSITELDSTSIPIIDKDVLAQENSGIELILRQNQDNKVNRLSTHYPTLTKNKSKSLTRRDGNILYKEWLKALLKDPDLPQNGIGSLLIEFR